MTGLGLRGRRLARLALFAAFGLVALEAAFFIAQPDNIGPMVAEGTTAAIGWVLVFGAAGQAIGLGWMIRIYRADPEGRRSWFRSISS